MSQVLSTLFICFACIETVCVDAVAKEKDASLLSPEGRNALLRFYVQGAPPKDVPWQRGWAQKQVHSSK